MNGGDFRKWHVRDMATGAEDVLIGGIPEVGFRGCQVRV